MKLTPWICRWLAVLAFLTTAAANAAAATKTGHREGIERMIGGDGHYLFASTNQEPHWHSVIMHPGAHTPVIHWYDKLDPVWWLGNAEEPVPPSWY